MWQKDPVNTDKYSRCNNLQFKSSQNRFGSKNQKQKSRAIFRYHYLYLTGTYFHFHFWSIPSPYGAQGLFLPTAPSNAKLKGPHTIHSGDNVRKGKSNKWFVDTLSVLQVVCFLFSLMFISSIGCPGALEPSCWSHHHVDRTIQFPLMYRMTLPRHPIEWCTCLYHGMNIATLLKVCSPVPFIHITNVENLRSTIPNTHLSMCLIPLLHAQPPLTPPLCLGGLCWLASSVHSDGFT